LLSNFDIPFFAILLAGLFFHFSDISSRLNIANPTLKAMRIALFRLCMDCRGTL
jgi:hypothetical protein